MSEPGADPPIHDEPPRESTPVESERKSKRVDRWAHRRGEPRMFAFWWAMFLLGATLISFSLFGLRPQATLETYRPAARLLITTAMIGAVILWPMVRLSQLHPRWGRFPESGPRAIAKDVLVVLAPLLAVVVPQAWLAEWPIEVTAGLTSAAAAWTTLTGAILLIGIETGRRTSVMLLIVVLALAPPAWLALRSETPSSVAWAAWPLTLPDEFTRDRSWTGAIAAISPGHWRVVGVLWCATLAAWCLAILVSRSRRGHRRSRRGYT